MISIDVVIPVLNEEHSLPLCIDKLKNFLDKDMTGYDWRIVIADNGSTDQTRQLAESYAIQYPERILCIHLDERGRGRALKKAWTDSDRDILCYMDVDLSTSLEYFYPLVKAIDEEGCHIATGSRLSRLSLTKRSHKREAISRIYNLIIKIAFATHFSDAQCGFKAISKSAAKTLLPVIQDNHWFFDTELLIVAEKRGFSIKDIPVVWDEDPDSRVNVFKTAVEDLKGLFRLKFGGIPRVIPPSDQI